jgi:hypothetical protein
MLKSKVFVLPALASALLMTGCAGMGERGGFLGSIFGGGDAPTARAATPPAADTAPLASANAGVVTSGASAAGAAGATGTAARSGATPAATIPVLVLVPEDMSKDPTLYNGCWAQLVDKQQTPNQSDLLTVVGRMYMPSLQTASGVNWNGKADGLVIGPNAVVTAYPAPEYKGNPVVLKSGRVIADVRQDLGFVSAIGSMKVECAA